MSAVRITAALVIVALGAVALITGDVGIAGGWLIAFGLAATGIAGLVSAAIASRSDSPHG